ncbi:hypothetical protein [Cupriavidus sp. AU9028]|uniref:hypothetical protein n=1 Tax=Cupriavidus sp. AU9028 TaxID=2871157 RepID=UPI001C937C8F|nr:hypothetical protein [Cupriavidus sp. AU9028]MBY4895609.1 hypothetical protein [Cupriavidus sp. AU9028]
MFWFKDRLVRITRVEGCGMRAEQLHRRADFKTLLHYICYRLASLLRLEGSESWWVKRRDMADIAAQVAEAAGPCARSLLPGTVREPDVAAPPSREPAVLPPSQSSLLPRIPCRDSTVEPVTMERAPVCVKRPAGPQQGFLFQIASLLSDYLAPPERQALRYSAKAALSALASTEAFDRTFVSALKLPASYVMPHVLAQWEARSSAASTAVTGTAAERAELIAVLAEQDKTAPFSFSSRPMGPELLSRLALTLAEQTGSSLGIAVLVWNSSDRLPNWECVRWVAGRARATENGVRPHIDALCGMLQNETSAARPMHRLLLPDLESFREAVAALPASHRQSVRFGNHFGTDLWHLVRGYILQDDNRSVREEHWRSLYQEAVEGMGPERPHCVRLLSALAQALPLAADRSPGLGGFEFVRGFDAGDVERWKNLAGWLDVLPASDAYPLAWQLARALQWFPRDRVCAALAGLDQAVRREPEARRRLPLSKALLPHRPQGDRARAWADCWTDAAQSHEERLAVARLLEAVPAMEGWALVLNACRESADRTAGSRMLNEWAQMLLAVIDAKVRSKVACVLPHGDPGRAVDPHLMAEVEAQAFLLARKGGPIEPLLDCLARRENNDSSKDSSGLAVIELLIGKADRSQLAAALAALLRIGEGQNRTGNWSLNHLHTLLARLGWHSRAQHTWSAHVHPGPALICSIAHQCEDALWRAAASKRGPPGEASERSILGQATEIAGGLFTAYIRTERVDAEVLWEAAQLADSIAYLNAVWFPGEEAPQSVRDLLKDVWHSVDKLSPVTCKQWLEKLMRRKIVGLRRPLDERTAWSSATVRYIVSSAHAVFDSADGRLVKMLTMLQLDGASLMAQRGFDPLKEQLWNIISRLPTADLLPVFGEEVAAWFAQPPDDPRHLTPWKAAKKEFEARRN